jgi:hypothetical protein
VIFLPLDKIGKRVGIVVQGKLLVARRDRNGRLTAPHLEQLRKEGKLEVDSDAEKETLSA